MRTACLVVLFAAGYGCGTRQPAAEVYRSAETLRRAGRLSEALSAARRGWKAQNPSDSEWQWKFRLLTSEVLLDRGNTKEALKLLSVPHGPADPHLLARWLLDRGDAAYWVSDYDASRSYLSQARELAARSGDDYLQALIEMRSALPVQEPGEKEPYYRRALQYASRSGDEWLLGNAYAGLGYSLLKQARYDEAIPWYELARKKAQNSGALRLLANVTLNLGLCAMRLGDFDRAARLLRESSSISDQIGDERNQQYCAINLGDLLERRGETAQAIELFHHARQLAETRSDRNSLSVVLNYLAEAYLEQGDTFSAEHYSKLSIDLRHQLPDQHQMIYSELTAARIALLARPPEQAERALRSVLKEAEKLEESSILWEAHGGLASLYRRTGRLSRADAEYRLAISVIRDRWSQVADEESQITYLAHLIRFYDDYVEFLVERGRPVDALAVADSARAGVLEHSLGADQRRNVQHSMDGVRSALAHSHAVALAYWTSPGRSFLWVVTPARVRMFPLPGEKQLAAMVDRYREDILSRRDSLSPGFPAGRRLYQTLVQPAASLIPKDAEVIVIPDGPLHRLNFETLVSTRGEPHYWIEDATLMVAPSLEVLRNASHAAAPDRGLLFIGDPVPPGSEFPPLPHLKEEAAVLARTFPERLRMMYTGRDATPEAFRDAQPGRFSVIHFAAHAVPNPESPLNSAVVLSRSGENFKLYARDVMNIPIHARLVTLSACHSAGARAYSGEGLIGFAWAFLHSGAQSVVAGLWDVDDAATELLMARFYGALARGAEAASALRAAKLELLRTPGAWRKPYFWAPFEVFTRVLPGAQPTFSAIDLAWTKSSR